jgi:O-acetyl-ADP-ribose deacetylase (regulator of RNase III)
MPKLKPYIEIIQGDIIKVEADAIVNAANETLRGVAGLMLPFIGQQVSSFWKNADP